MVVIEEIQPEDSDEDAEPPVISQGLKWWRGIPYKLWGKEKKLSRTTAAANSIDFNSMMLCLVQLQLLLVVESQQAVPGPPPPPRYFPHEQVSINLGWRFHLGDVTPRPKPTAYCAGSGAAFPKDLNAVQCLRGWCGACPGLLPLEAGYASDRACRAACCAEGRLCGAWQYANESDGRNCWAGPSCLQPEPSARYVGGARMANQSSKTGGVVPAAAAANFDDSSWDVVDTPHDFVSHGEYIEVGDEVSNSQGNLAKNTSWYRKRFKLPATWQGSHVELYVEGAYSIATYYLNGVLLGKHQNGYTSAIFRLDSVSAAALHYDGATDNVLAIHVDARMAHCTGWWYEGGGLFRNSYLISSSRIRLPSHGVFVTATVRDGGYTFPTLPREGITAASATVKVRATVEIADADDWSAIASGNLVVEVSFIIVTSSGAALASQTVRTEGAARQHTKQVQIGASLDLQNAEVWSIARPYLYTLRTAIRIGNATIDSANTTFGIRNVHWSADRGLLLNEQRVKMRGFCNHENFGGVGSAIPERINLFRLQQLRGVGGNAWRTSHNPPSPSLLKLADRLGVVLLDENRVFQTGLSHNMEDLVQRDRNSPAVLFYSFCNEPGCNNKDRSAPAQPSLAYKDAVEKFDGTRAVTGNMCLNWGSCPQEAQYLNRHPNSTFQMPQILDVQGFSHVQSQVFIDYHEAWPAKPLVASECCSCLAQRGEDADLTPYVNPKAPANATVFFSSLNVECVLEQTQWSDSLDFVSGSFVWTLHDYIGEPSGWPHVSSSFGSFDVAGFAKAAAYWYRSWWLANVSKIDAGRPGLDISPSADPTATFVRIVESPSHQSLARSVHVFTNAPFVRLSISGAAAPHSGEVKPVQQLSYATFNLTADEAGTEWKAEALDDENAAEVLAAHVVAYSGEAASVKLSIDAPTPRTGTGSALYLDGVDVALVRAEVVDNNGTIVHDCAEQIAFRVVMGPGMLVATVNGNPADHVAMKSTARNAYHGLARAIVRSSVDASGAVHERALRKLVNVDAGRGDKSATIYDSVALEAVTSDVVVRACLANLPCADLAIPTSTDINDSPFAVAAQSVALADISG